MKLLKLSLIIFMISMFSSFSLVLASEQVVQLDGDRLTLNVKNQLLLTILENLSGQGIRILIDPRINPRISATFDDRLIGSALSSILSSVNYALIWNQDDSSGLNEPRLAEIRIFYKGEGARVRPLKKSPAMTVVRHDDGTHYIKDIILLQLSPNMTESSLAKLMDQLGAILVGTQDHPGIVQLRLPAGSDVHAIARIVAGYPGIVAAEPDYAYSLEDGLPVAAGESAALPLSGLAPLEGSVKVAVMDSGLLADYGGNPYIQGAYDAVSPGTAISDLLGHGTQMALIAAGAVNPLGVPEDNAATSPVVVVRIIGDSGFTSSYTLIRGINYAIEEGARVISLSWGSETDSPILETAIDYAAGKGLVLVAAAGNVPTGNPVYPAAYDNVIGVGALTPDGEPWSQSNYGDFVTLYAPGVADLPVGYEGDPGMYAGTSIATAYTAHRVASILDHIPDADMETILLNLADIFKPGDLSKP